MSDLAHRDRPIAVVARCWGFTDPSYSSRRSRQASGTTPRDWRRSASTASAPPVWWSGRATPAAASVRP
ncbi:hypothetical protein ACI79E_06840 [Geodermatophilus sp. SYSU D00079]